MPRPRYLAALASLLATTAAAQSTLVVGPGGYQQIDFAIQAARPGDTILLAVNGRLDPFTLDRGVTIRSAPGFRPYVSNPILTRPLRDTHIDVPQGQRAELVGIDFTPEPTPFQLMFHGAVSVGSGTVAFRSCNFLSASSFCGAGAPALEVRDSAVALQDCRLFGMDYRSPGLRAIRSTLSFADSSLRGGPGCHDGLRDGAAGLELVASTLHACRIDVTGGTPVPFYATDRGGDGIVVDAGSRLWLSDALVSGADTRNVGTGGDAIVNLSMSPVELRNVTLTPGSGPTPGTPVRGFSTTNPALLSVRSTPRSGPAAGTNLVLDAVTAPRGLAAFGFSVGITVTHLPPFEQPLWLATGTSGPVWVAVPTDGQGRASYSLAVPPAAVSRGATLFSQTVALAGNRLELGPLRGGQVW